MRSIQLRPSGFRAFNRVNPFRCYASSADKYKEHCVVPDLLKCPPKEDATVCWPTGAKANFGNCLTPEKVKDIPKVSWQAQPGCFYMVCMLDIDAPCRKAPSERSWLHWLVGNVPGCEICKGCCLVGYLGALPAEGTGLHRYVVLVYKQKGKQEYKEKKIDANCPDGRAKFCLSKFIEKYCLVDPPQAGNFFQAQWECYVNKKMESLKCCD